MPQPGITKVPAQIRPAAAEIFTAQDGMEASAMTDVMWPSGNTLPAKEVLPALHAYGTCRRNALRQINHGERHRQGPEIPDR
jgi:hypothetical protein